MVKQIQNTLCRLGIPPSCLGWHYLTHLLYLRIQNEKHGCPPACETLYAGTASHYHTSRHCVEHCVRAAAAHCWNHGNRTFLTAIADHPIKKKPTENELIEILHRHLTVQPGNP